MAGDAALERALAKLERGVSDAYDCGASLTQQCTSPAAEEEALALASLVSHKPLAPGRIFPREVIARGGSRRRSSTGSRGGLRDLERGSYELVALSQS